MSCFTKFANFLLNCPIWLKAWRLYAKNLKIFKTSILLRPIKSDNEHTFTYGFINDIVRILAPLIAALAAVYYSTMTCVLERELFLNCNVPKCLKNEKKL